jgi:hypothetical protein
VVEEGSAMKLIGVTFCLITVVCATGLGASTSQTETKSKITVKDGKSVTVTGCVAPMVTGPGFMLTNVADKTGALHSYMLISEGDDLSKHVGHRVELSGKVTDRGDAKLRIETKTKTVGHGDDKETTSKTDVQGDAAGLPYFGVKSVKMIAAVCP